MTPKEWSIEAFEMCDHAGMICMTCVEKAISAALEEDRQNGADELLREGVPSVFESPV